MFRRLVAGQGIYVGPSPGRQGMVHSGHTGPSPGKQGMVHSGYIGPSQGRQLMGHGACGGPSPGSRPKGEYGHMMHLSCGDLIDVSRKLGLSYICICKV